MVVQQRHDGHLRGECRRRRRRRRRRGARVCLGSVNNVPVAVGVGGSWRSSADVKHQQRSQLHRACLPRPHPPPSPSASTSSSRRPPPPRPSTCTSLAPTHISHTTTAAMADSMEGVVTEAPKPTAEQTEQQTIAGKHTYLPWQIIAQHQHRLPRTAPASTAARPGPPAACARAT